MALSSGSFNGTINGRNGQYVTYKMDWSVNSVNQTGKTANVTLHAYAKANDTRANQYNASAPTKTYYIINGTKTNVIDKRVNADFRNKGSVDFGTWTGNISYGSSSKLTITAGSEFNMNIGTNWLDGGSVSGNITLPDLYEESFMGVSTDGVIGNIATINIYSCASEITNSFKIQFGSISGYLTESGTLSSSEVKLTSGSYNSANKNYKKTIKFTIPDNFYGQIPNAKKGNATLTLTTYNGSTKIGNSEVVSIEIKIDESECIPSITKSYKDINNITKQLTGNELKIIKGYSTLSLSVSGTPKKYALIKQITIDGANYNNVVSATKEIQNVSKSLFKISVLDSRGLSASEDYDISNIINYIMLTCNAKFKRQTQTSTEVLLNYSGNYFNDSFGAVANTLTLNWQYKQKGTSEWINGGTLTPTLDGNTYSGSISCGEIADLDKAYEFRVLYKDKLIDANTGSIVVTQANGALEIYAKSIWVAGQKFLWWD